MALDSVLKEMTQENIQLKVLLYQGLLNRSPKGEPATEALKAAQSYPEFQILMCLSEEDEPSSNPITINHDNKNNLLLSGWAPKVNMLGF